MLYFMSVWGCKGGQTYWSDPCVGLPSVFYLPNCNESRQIIAEMIYLHALEKR